MQHKDDMLLPAFSTEITIKIVLSIHILSIKINIDYANSARNKKGILQKDEP